MGKQLDYYILNYWKMFKIYWKFWNDVERKSLKLFITGAMLKLLNLN